MFKTRKTLEIEYDPTSQELEHLKDTVGLVGDLAEFLEREDEEIVYFNDNQYRTEDIRNVFYFLNDMLEQRYSSNILKQ